MKRRSALIIGNSSTLMHLAFTLCNSNCQLTLYPFTQIHQFLPDSTWKMHGNLNSFEFKPHLVICNMEQLTNSLRISEESYFCYDYIIFDTKFMDVLRQIPILFKKVLKPDTIILHITAGFCPILSLDKVFTHYCVLTMVSNIDCRLVDPSTNSFVLVNTNQEVMIGSVSSSHSIATAVALKLQENVGKRLEWMKTAYDSLSNVTVFVLFNNRPLIDAIREKTINIVCLESLSIVFDETIIAKLLQNEMAIPVINGAYQELILVSHELYKPLYASESYTHILETLLEQESRVQAERSLVALQKPNLPKFFPSNSLYYNFRQGYEMTNILLLQNVLKQGATFALNLPFIDSIYRFLIKVATTAQANKQGDKNMTKLKDVNGIPPEMNIMNFPPFLPLPNPTPPTISNGKSLTSHEDKINSQLRELMVGREELTYGPKVYDADQIKTTSICEMEPKQQFIQGAPPQFIQEVPPQSIQEVPPQSIQEVPPQFIQKVPPQFSPTFIPPHSFTRPNQHPQPTSQPSPVFPTQVRDRHGNAFILHPNGVITPIGSQPSPHEPLRTQQKPKLYSHVLPTVNRNTSSQRLRESQANLLNVVHFQGIVEMSSSRYGGLDSSTTLVNSANSSTRNSATNSNISFGTSSNSSNNSINKGMK